MTSTEYKSRRARLGLTQTALAAKLGVSSRTIKSRESGSPITPEAALAIIALDRSPEQALGRIQRRDTYQPTD